MMLQKVNEYHRTDENDNPAGGVTEGTGIEINWQSGTIQDGTPNGAFVEGVIAAAIGRLEFYQQSKFSCRENALAITKLQEAIHWLQHRTAEREARGVEGTHQV
jgi:hypothetical protein